MELPPWPDLPGGIADYDDAIQVIVYWESRCRLAVDALKQCEMMRDDEGEIPRLALADIGELPNE